MSESLIASFPKMEILLMSDIPFHYVSGGVGPYYIDLRKGPNCAKIFAQILGCYVHKIDKPDKPFGLIGVPTTGVVYATGLAFTLSRPLGVVEKLNPERMHFYSSKTLTASMDGFEGHLKTLGVDVNTVAFLGLEDMGVIFATGMGLRLCRPSAILRRIPKGHGTSKTIEANLDRLWEEGVRNLIVMNDPYYPMCEDDIIETIESIQGADRFHISVTSSDPLDEMSAEAFVSETEGRLIEVEDLWTTGTSAINLHQAISKNLGISAEVLVFLDRLQHAKQKFDRLNIEATSVCTIGQVAEFLFREGSVTKDAYEKVTSYMASFSRPSFSDLLIEKNKTCVCVGLDITPGKFPQTPEDTTLPHYPYPPTADGVRTYCLDLLQEVSKVEGLGVIKPNLAYYNSLDNTVLHSILSEVLTIAHEKGILVILDTKIGDIMRTQSQYAEKYKAFDAVTAHGFMGGDSIFPLTDAMLGCYVLVFTSNPTRVDLETQPLLTRDAIDTYNALLKSSPMVTEEEAFEAIVKRTSKVYHQMAQKVIDWQYAGSVGAVIGGTPNKDGRLTELEEIVAMFAKALDYLPPILIPGVGTQGGSATDVIHAILSTLSSFGWGERKIRREIRKVVINSSSAIDYSPRPREAVEDLVKEIRDAIEGFFLL